MKKHIHIIITILASICLCACSNPIEITDEYPGKVTRPIEITCNINQRDVTRVANGSFSNNDAIGVYIVDYINGVAPELASSGNHANNVKFTYNGTSWENNVDLSWIDDEHADAYSYYPYVSNIDDVKSLSYSIQNRQDIAAQEDAISGYDASDFMWAKAENVAPGSVFYLNHKHIMSAIHISLLEGEGFEEEEWAMEEKAISILNTQIIAKINLREGVATVDNDSEIKPIIPRRTNDSWQGIVVPQIVEANRTLIQISIAGNLYEFKRDEATTYEASKQNNFTIKVDKRGVGDYKFTLISESITAWQSDTNGVDADARAYIIMDVPSVGMLQSVIDQKQLNYNSIVNLKITGEIGDSDFRFIRDELRFLEAINLQDAKLENDFLPHGAFCGGLNNEVNTLKYVVFPNQLTKIGDIAFLNTSLCQELVFPEGLTHIGDRAFDGNPYKSPDGWDTERNNTNIYGVYFPNSLKHIGARAFTDAFIKHELILPDNLEFIGEAAFDNCRYIVGNLHIPEKIKDISTRAFSTLLSTSGVLEIPASVETIGLGAFASSGFNGLILNEGLKSIGEAAFAGIVFKNGYNHIDPNEYDLATKDAVYNIKPHPYGGELVVPTSVQFIGKRAFANTAFTHAYLPDNFEELPEGLFAYCTELIDTVRVQSKVTHLHAEVFKNCEKLSAVILPEKLISIADRCFENCFNLNYVQCLSTTPPTLEGSGHFDGVAKDNFTLVVPKGCVEAYRNAPGWGEFKRISEYRNFVIRPMLARLLNNSNERKIILNSDEAWSVSHIPNWVKISETSGYKKTELTVTIDELPTGAGNRADSIVFKLEGEDITACYYIEQYDSKYGEDEQEILQTATKGNGINIIILGDGYDAKDIADGLYEKDMKQSIEYLFDIEPYKTYREYFNVYTAYAMSYESGIGTVNTLRNVKFNTFGGDANHRLTCDFEAALYYGVDNTDVEESEIPGLTCIVIPNTSLYDGVCSMYPNNSAVALCPKGENGYPYDARGILQHEVGGHAFGKLADEYIYHYSFIQTCTCICCKHVSGLQEMHDLGWGYNMWLSGKYNDVPWSHLINDNRYNDIVDIYEGGYFHKRGVYRSEYNSCMNNNVPYFSSWSRELIVQRIKALAGENYSYEEFVANDSREWGKDFTLGTRAREVAPSEFTVSRRGNAPIISNHNPVRPK